MFQEIKNQEAEQKPDIQAFLALYAKFRAGADWLAQRKAAGQDIKADLTDFHKLEAQTDQAWDNMADEQKDSILLVLAQKKAFPLEVCQAKELFDGKLVSIT